VIEGDALPINWLAALAALMFKIFEELVFLRYLGNERVKATSLVVILAYILEKNANG
jgi:hypothetical protein